MALGQALSALKGFVAAEVEQVYSRARTLCEEVGDQAQRFTILWGLWRCYQGRGTLTTAQELGVQLLQLSARAADPTLRVEVHDALGYDAFYRGHYRAAQTHLEWGMTSIDLASQRTLVLRQGLAAGVTCLAVSANALWCLGYPTQAVQRLQEAFALAQELAHPYSLAAVQYWAAFLSYRRRETLTMQEQAEAFSKLATAQGFPLYLGFATCWHGWAIAQQGDDTTGLALLHHGLEAITAAGHALPRQIYLTLLAEASAQSGQPADGLRHGTTALTTLTSGGRGDRLAEAYRMQGTLLLRLPQVEPQQAETCFQQALTIARQQQARSWELRAAVSLSRLWRQQDQRAAAYALLVPLYDGSLRALTQLTCARPGSYWQNWVKHVGHLSAQCRADGL